MIKIRAKIALSAVVVLFTPLVQAATLTFDFVGIYPRSAGDFVHPLLQERFGTSGTFSGSITIKDGIADINANASQGQYLDAITSFSVTLNPDLGATHSSSDASPFNDFKIIPGNNAIGGATTSTGIAFTSSGQTWNPEDMSISFVKAGVLTNDTLSLSTLQGFHGATLGTLNIRFSSVETSLALIRGGVTSVTAGQVMPTVPIPAAVWLFGSALGMLGWMRRKAA